MHRKKQGNSKMRNKTLGHDGVPKDLDEEVALVGALSDIMRTLRRPGSARQKYHNWRREQGMADIGEDGVTQKMNELEEKLRQDLLGELSPEEFLLWAIAEEEKM
jgi:hypothetical protein